MLIKVVPYSFLKSVNDTFQTKFFCKFIFFIEECNQMSYMKQYFENHKLYVTEKSVTVVTMATRTFQNGYYFVFEPV